MRPRGESGFAAIGDFLVKAVVFVVVLLIVTGLLALLGVDFKLTCVIGAVVGVLGAARSGVN